MLAANRAMTAATAAGAAAAPFAASRASQWVAARKMGGGLVAGQDTPMHKDQLPDRLTHEYRAVEEAPVDKEGEAAAAEGASSSIGGGSGDTPKEGVMHAQSDFKHDMYSGTDPTQAEAEGKGAASE